MNKLYILIFFLSSFFAISQVEGGHSSIISEEEERLMYQAAPVLHEPSSISSDGFLLLWSPSSGATSYILDIAYNSSFTSYVSGFQNKSITGSSYYGSQLAMVIAPLDGNTFYYCRLRAVGPGGTSSYSNVIEVPIDVASSVVPTLFVHYANASTLYLSWEQSSGSTYYELDVAYDASFSSYVNGYYGKDITGDFGTGNISYSVTGLKGKTKYYCRVRGAGPTGVTAFSNVISVTTSLAIPDAPTAVSAIDITTESATLRWEDEHMADSYRLDVSTSSSFDSFVNGYENRSVSGTSLAIDGLSANTTYYYRVRAVNSQGTSGNSNTVSFKTPNHVQPSLEQNYILAYTPIVGGLTNVEQVVSGDVDEVSWSVQYFDGLGRPSQKVNAKASPGRKDIVQPVYYDEFGREARRYMPYVDNGPYYGSFRTGALSSQEEFYGPSTPGSTVASDPRPFSETVFEASPLDRPLKDYGPGQDWYDKDRFVEHQYLTNVHGTGAGQERVIAWAINAQGMPVRNAPVTGHVEPGGYYATGQLYVKATMDEDGGTVREYTDKLGRTVLKKVQLADTLPVLNDREHWAQTYYIHDDLGNLRFVLQPELALKAMQDDSYVPSQADLDRLAFQHRYDHRNRMIEKRVPGSGWVYMVYDKRDRLVLAQDGNQREKGEWSFTKYDALNRPVSTGIYPHSDTAQADMQAILDTFYNNATNDGYHEERGSAVHGYTNRSFPQVSDEDAYLTVTYYDNYGFKDMIGHAGYDYKNDELPNQETTENARVKGLVTGTKTRVLGTNQFLWSVTYYDKKYRPVQTAMGNYPDGLDRVTNIYNFPGWLMETRLSHQGEETATVHMSFNYDHTGRLLETYHKINNGDPVQLSRNEYNELGELVTKNLYKEGSTYAQSVDYRYNIRGWLKRINNSDLSPDAGDHKDDLFGMELSYNEGFEVPQYNGNISGARWKNAVDNTERAYGYTYDPMNRLTGADYVAGGPGGWTKEEERFEVGNIGYDHNGNILALDRNGLFRHTMGEAPEYGITDQLSYHYRGNQLMAVNDAMDTPEGNASDFRDNGSKGSLNNPEYAYDANGNMTADGNKGITVTYNHLNLPERVDFGNNKYIEYTYDATGTKLRQEVHDGENPVKRTDYVGGMVYEDGQLQFIQHGEGRIVMVDNDGLSKFPEYQYHLKDHLGNVRLTFSAEPVTESNTATLETIHEDDESATFLRYAETTKINSTLFDHTGNGDTHYAVRLNGAEHERIGLARSLAVMTGDTVRAEVYAKYLDPDPSNWTAALHDLMAAIAGGTAPTGTVIEAVPSVGGDGFPFAGLLDAAKAGDTGTRAYLNILVFDENLAFLDAAFVPVSMAAREDGTNVPHEKLSGEIVVQQPGYAYIYFSNDNGQPLEVFFDDFTVTHSHSAIVQADDYYPFGLSFNSYKRENSVKNNWKFQGQEHIEDMGLNWISFKWRNHDPAIGRFFNVDPLAESYVHNSPYAFSENKVISHIELEGLEAIDAQAAFKKALVSDKVQNKVSQTNASSRNMFKAEVGVHGAGLGGSVKLGSAGTLGGSAKLAKVDGSITNSGGVNVEGSLVHLEGEATIAGVGGEAELGLGNGSFGMQNGELIGDASLADVSANGVGGNASLDTSGEFGVGIVLGNIAAEVSVSLDAMGEFIKGTVDIIGAVVGEMVNSVMNPVEQIPTEKIDLQY